MARSVWRVARVLVAVLLGVLLILGVSGYFLFTSPQGEPLSKADAVVVLGGEDDGRMEYGLELAHQGYADTVVISNSYEPGEPTYTRACASGTATVTVICFRPSPFTTRGEAMFVQRLAAERHWHHVIVVSWNFHLVRARYIFHQCFDGTVTMRPSPRLDHHNLLDWAAEYAYQYGALVKAAVLGCANS